MCRHKFFLLFLFFPVFVFSQATADDLDALYQSGHYADVIAQATVFLQKNPDQPRVLMLKADGYQKMDELDSALTYYDKAKLSGYSDDILYLHRGICKLSLHLYDAARFDLSSYLTKKRSDARGYYWMGTLEYLSGENKASLRYLNAAIDLDSTYAEAYYLRGANDVELGRKNFAKDDFDEAYRYNPQLMRAKMNSAVLMLDMGNYEASFEMLSELKLEAIDFVAEVLYYRGEALFRMHDLEGACKDWGESAAYGDADAQANHRRLCVSRQGKPKFKRRSYGQF